jgi:hypothetical protein
MSGKDRDNPNQKKKKQRHRAVFRHLKYGRNKGGQLTRELTKKHTRSQQLRGGIDQGTYQKCGKEKTGFQTNKTILLPEL